MISTAVIFIVSLNAFGDREGDISILPDYAYTCRFDAETAGSELRRQRPLVHVHLSHGGGHFIANLAKLNHERTFLQLGSCDGDLPRLQPVIRLCDTRRREFAMHQVTFAQVERGLESGEFCPQIFDYVLFVRDPIMRMDSHLSKYNEAEKIITYIEHGRGKSLTVPFESEFNRMLFAPGTNRGEGLANFDNILTRWLTFTSYWLHAPVGHINYTAYTIALANLKKFKLYASLSHLNNSVLRTIGWSYAGADRAERHHHADHRLTPGQLDRLRALNVWDLKLYSFAMA